MKVLVLGPNPPMHSEMMDLIWIPIVRIEPRVGSSIELLRLPLSSYRAIAFTSPRGPEALALDAIRHGVFDDLRDTLEEVTIAVVGPRTGESLRRFFRIEWDIMPSVYTGSSLALAIVNRGVNDVVLARSAKGVRDLPALLSRHRVNYVEVAVYDEIVDWANTARMAELVKAGGVDVVLLTSPLIAHIFCSTIIDYPSHVRIYAIGPSTARTARNECGVSVRHPDKYTYADALALIKRDSAQGAGALTLK